MIYSYKKVFEVCVSSVKFLQTLPLDLSVGLPVESLVELIGRIRHRVRYWFVSHFLLKIFVGSSAVLPVCSSVGYPVGFLVGVMSVGLLVDSLVVSSVC